MTPHTYLGLFYIFTCVAYLPQSILNLHARARTFGRAFDAFVSHLSLVSVRRSLKKPSSHAAASFCSIHIQ